MSDSNWGERSEALAEQGESSQGGNEAAQSGETQKPAQPNDSPPAINEVITPDEGKVSQSEAERQEQDPYKARDIVAQEAMADASIAMAVAAFLTFLVTTAGTILIWKQIKLLNKTVHSTNDATEAVKSQNEIAKAQQRARFSVQVVSQQVDHDQGVFILRCENIGPTPAFNVRCAARTMSIVPDTPPDWADWGERRTIKPGEQDDLGFMEAESMDQKIIGCIEFDTLHETGCRKHFAMRFEQSKFDGNFYNVECTPANWPKDT